jgi:hypothetical protein
VATRIYIIWILALTVGWALVFGHFNKYFDGAELEKSVDFKYDEVTIYSKDHSIFDEAKKEEFGKFFFTED